MHVVIMGCGRVGSLLAHALVDRDHSVAIIDQRARAFRRLGTDFVGQRVTGVGYDPDVLCEAGIERAHAFAAVSSGDNSNVIATRVARERFGVDQVVARIYDPKRAEVYQRLGIPTVATVRWTADRVLRRLLPPAAHTELLDPTGRLALAEFHLDVGWVGRRLTDVEPATGARIAFLTRLGEGMLPTPETLIQEGDLVHLVLPPDAVDRVAALLSGPPTATDS